MRPRASAMVVPGASRRARPAHAVSADPSGSASGVSRTQIEEIQRARLLSAAVGAIDELGYPSTTVAHITARAGVSRRTFYDLFENCEECLLTVLEDILVQIQGELADANLDELAWRERIRLGLWTVLCFFDREPALARICVVQSARGSQLVLERREALLAALAGVIDEGRGESARVEECAPLTAEGLVGASVSILYTRLLKRERKPLTDLLGELVGMIVGPYLGPAAARRERTRPAPTRPASSQAGGGEDTVPRGSAAVLQDIPMRLTYRTVRVLEAIAAHPGASNRSVAERVGISDQGQVSKLLARLHRLGLLENTGEGHTKGEPNAWRLSEKGRQVARSIRIHTHDHKEAA